MYNETTIQKRIEAWAEAVKSQDISRLSEYYAPGTRVFDAVSPLQVRGRDTYMEHWQKCLSNCKLSIFKIDEMVIEADENVAACCFLNYCGGIDDNGKEEACWLRATQIYRKIEDDWLIIHEHFSVPFDMKTGETCFGLKP